MGIKNGLQTWHVTTTLRDFRSKDFKVVSAVAFVYVNVIDFLVRI